MIWYPLAFWMISTATTVAALPIAFVDAAEGTNDLGQPGPRPEMTGADRSWPPLIVADHVPRFIRWRDFLLTLLMWIAFAIILETEFEMFFGDYLERLGIGDFDTEANWPIFFERLIPFLATTTLLISLLIVASIRTSRRRRRALLLPIPVPLGLAEQCRRAGVDEHTLISARDLKIVIVHIDPAGKHRIDGKEAV
jgi:hypothetical protein